MAEQISGRETRAKEVRLIRQAERSLVWFHYGMRALGIIIFLFGINVRFF